MLHRSFRSSRVRSLFRTKHLLARAAVRFGGHIGGQESWLLEPVQSHCKSAARSIRGTALLYQAPCAARVDHLVAGSPGRDSFRAAENRHTPDSDSNYVLFATQLRRHLHTNPTSIEPWIVCHGRNRTAVSECGEQ